MVKVGERSSPIAASPPTSYPQSRLSPCLLNGSPDPPPALFALTTAPAPNAPPLTTVQPVTSPLSKSWFAKVVFGLSTTGHSPRRSADTVECGPRAFAWIRKGWIFCWSSSANWNRKVVVAPAPTVPENGLDDRGAPTA